MKLSVSAFRAQAHAHKKILSSSFHPTHYGSTATSSQFVLPTTSSRGQVSV